MTNYQSTGNPDLGSEPLLASKSPKVTKFVYCLAILSALGGFFFGYDTGAASAAIALVRSECHFGDLWHEGLIASSVASAWLVSIPGGIFADAFGRRYVILFASFAYTVGAIVSGVSETPYVLLVGRMILGVGIGLASVITTMYIAEIAPATSRGKLVCLNGLLLSFGRVVGALVSVIFHKDEMNGWRYMLGLAAIPGLIQFVGFLFLPESPRWLISKGRFEEAKSVLQRSRELEDVEDEFNSMKESFDKMVKAEESEVKQFKLKKIFRTKSVRKALFIGCLLQIFQQLCGINTVMYYSGSISRMSGFTDPSLVVWLSVVVTTVNFVTTAISIFTVDKLGRRKLVLISLAGIVFSLAFMSVSFSVIDTKSAEVTGAFGQMDKCARASTCGECVDKIGCGFCTIGNSSYCLKALPYAPERGSMSYICEPRALDKSWYFYWCPSNYAWMAMLALICYLIFYSPGMGPIPWVVNSEIYPTWARSTCNSIATSTNWFFNLLTSCTFLSIVSAIDKEGAFGLYAFFSLIGLVIFYFFLPETKGVPLDKMGELFSSVPDGLPEGKLLKPDPVQYVKIRGIDVSGEEDD